MKESLKKFIGRNLIKEIETKKRKYMYKERLRWRNGCQHIWKRNLDKATGIKKSALTKKSELDQWQQAKEIWIGISKRKAIRELFLKRLEGEI